MKKLGTLFGKDLWIDTDNEDILKNAYRYINSRLRPRAKVDRELEDEVEAFVTAQQL